MFYSLLWSFSPLLYSHISCWESKTSSSAQSRQILLVFSSYVKDVVNPLWISHLSLPSFSRSHVPCGREVIPSAQSKIRCCVEMRTRCQIQLDTVRDLRSWPGIDRFQCLFSHNNWDSIHMDELHAIPKGRFPLCLYTHVSVVPDSLAMDLAVRPTQTVLSITHSELSKVGFSSSLSSYCSSMPFTDRLRLVQMLLILRG